LRNKLAHPAVAPDEGRGIVVIADPLVFHHVLQIADQGGGLQVVPAGRDQRLVLMQCDGGGGPDLADVQAAPGGEQRLRRSGGDDRGNLGLLAADVGYVSNIFRQWVGQDRLR
jgi:hypothetical protein